jgi:DNA-binding transcriptional ArsR family regulator
MSDALQQTFDALADPTRRAILRRLARGPSSISDLARPFGMSLEGVSKHVRVLERARLVHRRREGRAHVLTLDPAPMDRVAAWIDEQRALWSSRLQALDELLRTEDRECAASSQTKAKAKARTR